MNYKHLQQLREHELSLIIPDLLSGQVLLELGAGAGWQAQILSTHGLHVEAIDVEESNYTAQRVWPVTLYDGTHIPFPDQHFDVVFSSNVLEHIAHVESFQAEIQRVLKPQGQAIHLMPTPSWRFWTTLAGYGALVKKIFQKLFGARQKSENIAIDPIRGTQGTSTSPSPAKLVSGLRNVFFPPRHGEIGNTVTELYYFSAGRWRRLFQRTGWQVEQVSPNRLFYTGWDVFGNVLSLQTRQKLSRLLGSSCMIYIVRKRE